MHISQKIENLAILYSVHKTYHHSECYVKAKEFIESLPPSLSEDKDSCTKELIKILKTWDTPSGKPVGVTETKLYDYLGVNFSTPVIFETLSECCFQGIIRPEKVGSGTRFYTNV
jgi:hypothetical protein